VSRPAVNAFTRCTRTLMRVCATRRCQTKCGTGGDKRDLCRWGLRSPCSRVKATTKVCCRDGYTFRVKDRPCGDRAHDEAHGLILEQTPCSQKIKQPMLSILATPHIATATFTLHVCCRMYYTRIIHAACIRAACITNMRLHV